MKPGKNIRIYTFIHYFQQDVFLLDEVRFGDSITTDEYVNKDGDYAIETWALTFRWPTTNRCNSDESEENGNAKDHPKKQGQLLHGAF